MQANAKHNAEGRRGGFTLVELLVVMGLLVVLASLAVMILPSISSDNRTSQGATQLQQWLEIAKQRAMRDKAPRGLRFLPGTVNPRYVTDLEYVEQPPDFYLGSYPIPLPKTAPTGPRKTTYYSRATVG